MLCGSTGFRNLAFYCGKGSDRKSPLGSYVVKKMLIPVTNKASHINFFDTFLQSTNFFPIFPNKAFERVVQLEKNALDIILSRQTKSYRSRTKELMISDQTEPCSV